MACGQKIDLDSANDSSMKTKERSVTVNRESGKSD